MARGNLGLVRDSCKTPLVKELFILLRGAELHFVGS